MSTIKRIESKYLKVGMYVAEINNEWVPDNHLHRYGLIKREEAIRQVLNLGVTHVFIDTAKGEDCQNGIAQEELNNKLENEIKAIQKNANQLVTKNDVDEELKVAKKLQVNALRLISQLADDVKMGNAIAIQDVEELADSINESISKNQNALACFTRLRHKDEYLMEHSFSVAVLMGILARSMGYGNDDLHQLVTGGLLHDIGKVQIDDTILHKPASLNPEEWAEMKRHVEYGENILAQSKDVPKRILQICSQHHERLDGAGYPRGLSGSALTEHGKMAAIVDVYDAITSHRVYHRGIEPTAAMKKILEWSDNHLDKDIAYQFIACMSIYPAGSLVELSGQQLAMVIEPNLLQQHKPVVKVVYDLKDKKTVVPKKINLANSNFGQTVIRAVDPLDYSIDLEAFI